MAVFSLALVSSLFFQANRWLTPGICLAYTLLNSLYYWLYARHQQVISPEEEVRSQGDHTPSGMAERA